jgi:adenosylhomocysteine nucleosidase
MKRILFLLVWTCAVQAYAQGLKTVVLVSADAEWRAVKKLFPDKTYTPTPYGECFTDVAGADTTIWLHGGWGKIAAAGSTQYAIDRWRPRLLVNLGTCGGIKGQINKLDVVIATETVVYDIYEAMGDASEAIAHYTTRMDLGWIELPFPSPVNARRIISADRDLVPAELAKLSQKYNAIVGDWETGAIAWVAARNNTRLIILRGVSDLVSTTKGEAYDGTSSMFNESAEQVMRKLAAALPAWLAHVRPALVKK